MHVRLARTCCLDGGVGRSVGRDYLDEDVLSDIVEIDLSLAFEMRCEGKRLATCSSTVIKDKLPRLAVHLQRDQLTRFVLDLEVPLLVLWQLVKVRLFDHSRGRLGGGGGRGGYR